MQSRLSVALVACALAAVWQPVDADGTAAEPGTFLLHSGDASCAVIGNRHPDTASGKNAIPQPLENDLTFSYVNWPLADEDSLRLWASLIKPIAHELMGDPGVPGIWTVRYDPESPYTGVCYADRNEIVLSDRPTLNPRVCETFAHELNHAWRDEFILWEQVGEEGLAESFTVIAFSLMPPYYHSASEGHLNSAYVTEMLANQPGISAPLGNSVLGCLTSLRNRLSGWLFWRLFMASGGTFYEAFHTRYFEQCRLDSSFPQNRDGVRALMRYVLPIIDGTPAEDWWDRQYITHLDWTNGDALFVYNDRVGAVCFWRDDLGGEYPYAGILVEWSVRNRLGEEVASESGTTGANGRILPTVSLPGSSGRGTVTIRAHMPNGVVEKTQPLWLGPSLPPDFTGLGLFGVCDGPDGPINVSSLDGTVNLTGSVVNGAFSFPEVGAGAYRITYNGGTCVIRKDTGPYLTVLNDQTLHQIGVAQAMPAAVLLVGESFPNPFRAAATIPFAVPSDRQVRLTIYGVDGRAVRTLVSGHQSRGSHEIVWDGRNDHGQLVPSGVYFLRSSEGGTPTKLTRLP